MRQTQIFSGSSHPALVEAICDRLGQKPAQARLSRFSNGETNIQIETSVRDQDVFIVQSGSSKINDAVMELLIMISACKGGSSKSITAVMPYFPYSRQSKKKSHRGAITARMLANLLEVSGVNHVITIDLHASQMQGFFRCPVDNLIAEPLLASWIKAQVPEWRTAVVVSKNPGGTKRVTSLADALNLEFGIIMTDRARPGSGRTSLNASTILHKPTASISKVDAYDDLPGQYSSQSVAGITKQVPGVNDAHNERRGELVDDATPKPGSSPQDSIAANGIAQLNLSHVDATGEKNISQSLSNTSKLGPHKGSLAPESALVATHQSMSPDATTPDEFNSHNHDIITGRLIHGHIVDDSVPSPPPSAAPSRPGGLRHHDSDDDLPDPMLSSVFSTTSSVHTGPDYGLGGSGDAVGSSDDEEEKLMDPDLESTVTLVGNVKDRIVLIVDDMIDKSASWIAAAETVVKRGGATKVYCIATHGLFGGDSLLEMEECECIHKVIVTNTFPVPAWKAHASNKLEVLDVSGLLSEAIRRNHHGESIHQLFVHND